MDMIYCENYTFLYNFLACKEVLYCHISYSLVKVVHLISHCYGLVFLEVIFMHVLTHYSISYFLSHWYKEKYFKWSQKMNVYNSTSSCPYVTNFLLFMQIYLFYGTMVLQVWILLVLSLKDQSGYCLNQQCKCNLYLKWLGKFLE